MQTSGASSPVTLVPIDRTSPLEFEASPSNKEYIAEIVQATRANYARAGYEPPWIGYLALQDSVIVGTCAFKAPPRDGEVEIAYHTMPGHERRGIATAMARELMKTAAGVHPRVGIVAHTQPEQNASTAILEKTGFERVGTVEDPEDGTVWRWRMPSSA